MTGSILAEIGNVMPNYMFLYPSSEATDPSGKCSPQCLLPQNLTEDARDRISSWLFGHRQLIICVCHPVPSTDCGEISSVGYGNMDYFSAYAIDTCGGEDIDIKASIPLWG